MSNRVEMDGRKRQENYGLTTSKGASKNPLQTLVRIVCAEKVSKDLVAVAVENKRFSVACAKTREGANKWVVELMTLVELFESIGTELTGIAFWCALAQPLFAILVVDGAQFGWVGEV